MQPVTLVHDLQNHDEITYQLVELEHRKDETFTVGGEKVTGKRAARADAAARCARRRPATPPRTTSSTGRRRTAWPPRSPASSPPALGVRDPYHATPEQVEQIRRGHLLLAAANALQPGVFSLSSWDLVGALPIPEEAVKRPDGRTATTAGSTAAAWT